MTTDHLYELQTAVIAALQGDTALHAMLNGVYGNVPADAKFPFVAVENMAAINGSSRTTSGWHIKIAINIFSRERGAHEASNIIARIRNVLGGAGAIITANASITSIKEADCLIARQRDGLTWQGIINFNVILQQGSNTFIANGSNFIIKIGDGASPLETFTTIGGLCGVSISLNNKTPNCGNLASSQWQELLTGAGVGAMMVSGNGFFTDSAPENRLFSLALSGRANNYQIILGAGEVLSGSFIVSSYKRVGNGSMEEWFDVTLQSNGAVAGPVALSF